MQLSKPLESGSVFKQGEDALLFSKQREGSDSLVESGQKTHVMDAFPLQSGCLSLRDKREGWCGRMND